MSEVVTEIRGTAGLITLDRPRAMRNGPEERDLVLRHRQRKRGFKDHPPRIPALALEPAHEQRVHGLDDVEPGLGRQGLTLHRPSRAPR